MRGASWQRVGRLAIALLALAWPAWPDPSHRVIATIADPTERTAAVADYAYRVVGRARVMRFTVSERDVGAGRLSWHRGGGRETVRLLVGSEPDRVPRDLNEWAYISEDSRDGRADVFAVRSMTARDIAAGPPAPNADPRTGQRRFRAVCASTDGAVVQTFTTTVEADGLITYRGLNHLLGRLTDMPIGKPSAVAAPADAAPGFLTALGRLLRASVDGSAMSSRQSSVVYVYDGNVYDLQLRRVRHRADLVVGAATYGGLLEGHFAVVRRRDNDETTFSVSYPATGSHAAVPVAITFRASWWLTVELQLDDRSQVPADPGNDAALSASIRNFCAPAWTH